MALVRQDLQKINQWVEATEGRISAVEDQLPPMQKALKTATQHIDALMIKVDDLDNGSRRNNVRLVGVPEKAYSDAIWKDSLSSFFAIERAHRVPTHPLPTGAPLRPILIKLLHFRDRDVILRTAQEKGDLTINGQRVSLFPNFTGETQKKRMLFQDIKMRLHTIYVPYSMQYPVKLSVVALNSTNFFETPKEALTWLNHRNLYVPLIALVDPLQNCCPSAWCSRTLSPWRGHYLHDGCDMFLFS